MFMKFWGRFFGITIASLLVASAALAMTQKPMTAEKAPPTNKRAIASDVPQSVAIYLRDVPMFFGKYDEFHILDNNLVVKAKNITQSGPEVATITISRYVAKSSGFDNIGALFSLLTRSQGLSLQCISYDKKDTPAANNFYFKCGSIFVSYKTEYDR